MPASSSSRQRRRFVFDGLDDIVASGQVAQLGRNILALPCHDSDAAVHVHHFSSGRRP